MVARLLSTKSQLQLPPSIPSNQTKKIKQFQWKICLFLAAAETQPATQEAATGSTKTGLNPISKERVHFHEAESSTMQLIITETP